MAIVTDKAVTITQTEFGELRTIFDNGKDLLSAGDEAGAEQAFLQYHVRKAEIGIAHGLVPESSLIAIQIRTDTGVFGKFARAYFNSSADSALSNPDDLFDNLLARDLIEADLDRMDRVLIEQGRLEFLSTIDSIENEIAAIDQFPGSVGGTTLARYHHPAALVLPLVGGSLEELEQEWANIPEDDIPNTVGALLAALDQSGLLADAIVTAAGGGGNDTLDASAVGPDNSVLLDLREGSQTGNDTIVHVPLLEQFRWRFLNRRENK